MRKLLLLLLILPFISCKEKTISPTAEPAIKKEKKAVHSTQGMVVSAREEASKIGIQILEQGGNAFDAMIAVQMALAVSFPNAGNLAGGGFMVYRTEFGETGSLNFREKAPLAATRDMFLDEDGNFITTKSKEGALAVGVPGTVEGIFAVHEKFGSLPMEILLQPVIDLAKTGFIITEQQSARFEKHKEAIERINGDSSIFTKTYQAGDVFKNPALAKTLERISTNGKSEFYKGETAKKMISYLKEKGGIMTMKDLELYSVVWQDPISFEFKNLKITSMGPPSSGGIALAQIFSILEEFPLAEYGHNSKKYIQILTEAERRAYADRSKYLGDPDFVEIPVDSLLSKRYILNRINDFSFDMAGSSEETLPGNFSEKPETTHFSIVDKFGNAVAVTTTLNGSFGSKLFIPELGFFLNNEMDDFSAKPGEPNMFGLVGGEANAIAPQKRMLSSMTPTIVEKEGKLFMVVGTPGGSTIITSVLQTILNVQVFGMDMQEAVNAPRFHHQWLPDVIYYEENAISPEMMKELENLGYRFDASMPEYGKVDAIRVTPDGKLEGGADPRGDDTAVGY